MNIGHAALGGTSTAISGTTGRLLYGTNQAAVLSANQEIFRFFIGYGGANNINLSTFQVGIYDVSGGNITTAPRLYSVTLSINNEAEGGNTAQRWIEFALTPFDMSAHAGKTLAVGFADPAANTGFNIPLITVTGASRKNHTGANGALPSTMANGTATSNQAWAMFFETRTIATPATPVIDTLGTAGAIRVGQTEPITTSNLGTLTSASFGSKAFASFAAPGGDGNVTLGGFVDGETYPAMGTLTVAAGDGTATASKVDATLDTMPDWQWVNVSAIDTTEFSLGKAFGGGDLPTQLHVIDDGVGVLNSNGTLTNWPVGTYTCWARMAAGTWPAGTMKSFTFTVHQPINTTSANLEVATVISSPQVVQDVIVTPANLDVITSVSNPVLSQSTFISPSDFSIAISLSQPSLSIAGYLSIDDLQVATVLSNPQLTQASSIQIHDITVSLNLSTPLVGDLPIGPIYGDRIVVILGRK
ncbi:MAG TPA: hypothetical protein VL995_11470 [Cellvibrio sp.]|nr:hypothetical protein [Cellvibrio sp.]